MDRPAGRPPTQSEIDRRTPITDADRLDWLATHWVELIDIPGAARDRAVMSLHFRDRRSVTLTAPTLRGAIDKAMAGSAD